MTDVAARIEEFIVKEFMFDKPEVTLSRDISLIQQGIIDSLGIFVLIAFIEKQFGIKCEPQDVVLENFRTVQAIERLVTVKLSSGAGG